MEILPKKGTISQMYDHPMILDAHSLFKTVLSWEAELGSKLTDEFWDVAGKRIYLSTSCAHLGLIQFKVLHRTHLSKTRLAEIYMNVYNRCDTLHPCRLSSYALFLSQTKELQGFCFCNLIKNSGNWFANQNPYYAVLGSRRPHYCDCQIGWYSGICIFISLLQHYARMEVP